MGKTVSPLKLFRHPVVRWLLRSPLGWAVLVVAGVAAYGYELQQREAMAYAGVPETDSWNTHTFTRVFRNEGFMLGYSEWRAAPLWVTYRLEQVRVPKRYKRPGSFRIDDRSIRRISHEDYTGSGYDRGHMAPNYAISQIHGRDAQRDTFLMTNVVPQRPGLNQKLWQRLEEAAVKHLTKGEASVWVVTGPIYGEKPGKLKSGVEIPEAFFKTLLRPPRKAGGEPRVLSFIMPQTVRGDEDLRRFVVSVDEIEARTGIDLFPKLDDWVEDRVEARSSYAGWGLKQVANLPGRYARR